MREMKERMKLGRTAGEAGLGGEMERDKGKGREIGMGVEKEEKEKMTLGKSFEGKHKRVFEQCVLLSSPSPSAFVRH